MCKPLFLLLCENLYTTNYLSPRLQYNGLGVHHVKIVSSNFLEIHFSSGTHTKARRVCLTLFKPHPHNYTERVFTKKSQTHEVHKVESLLLLRYTFIASYSLIQCSVGRAQWTWGWCKNGAEVWPTWENIRPSSVWSYSGTANGVQFYFRLPTILCIQLYLSFHMNAGRSWTSVSNAGVCDLVVIFSL